jgi:hypothetical protein
LKNKGEVFRWVGGTLGPAMPNIVKSVLRLDRVELLPEKSFNIRER